ncbi:MAG TPA: CHRD domain-containing protein [Sphingobacteriaceae bacterium]
MKTVKAMKQAIDKFYRVFLILALVTLALPGCDDDDDDQPQDNTRNITVQLSGANEAPPVNTTGSGTAEISYDPAMKMIGYEITWTLGSAADSTVGMHFHGSDAGTDTTSSPVVVPLTGFPRGNSGTFSGMTRALTDEEVTQLLAGKWYLNIHSGSYPAGEIRGNLKFP